jgi:NNP family nitrate/nitrite transporter-like MFS transporter
VNESSKSWTILTLNTLAFTVSFACWTMNGVLVTWLVDQMVFNWDKAQIGWLIGIPVLSGALARLPVGVLTDKFGGRPVFTLLMLTAAVPAWLLSYADSYGEFLLGSFGFGLAGATFAVGIAYTSVWFKRERQGTALGIFGIGNAGAALTSMGAPQILSWLTDNGQSPEGWRNLPRLYAAGLVATAIVFFLLTVPKTVEHGQEHSLRQRLAPLRSLRVWRFGLYYFVVFGGFVALAQWLIPYYVNVYGMSVALAGLVATIFTLPSGLIRALGGWMSDRWGARAIMYWVFSVCLLCLVLLCLPRMDVESPGEGVLAARGGVVTSVTPTEIVVGGAKVQQYPLRVRTAESLAEAGERVLVLPTASSWQEPVVQVGQTVVKKQLLARGTTHVFFQANVWIFTFLVFILGIAMGIGKAGVYKFIPDYFPKDVGVVGGIVGVIGGLGGFVCPILFGYLLRSSGIWTVTWLFLALVTVICLVWMHTVVRRILHEQGMGHQIEHAHDNERLPALQEVA